MSLSVSPDEGAAHRCRAEIRFNLSASILFDASALLSSGFKIVRLANFLR